MLRLQRRRTSPAGAGLSRDERRFALGKRTLADLLAPAAVEVARDHLRLEYQYARVLVLWLSAHGRARLVVTAARV